VDTLGYVTSVARLTMRKTRATGQL